MRIDECWISEALVRRLEGWQGERKTRGRGRSKQTWLRVIESDMQLLELDKNVALNRDEWREKIYADALCDY